jgi:hypothetical protein
MTTDDYEWYETGRRLLHADDDATRSARHLFPLSGISDIPAAPWTVYYRCQTLGGGFDRNDNVHFNIDILVRRADGSVRTTIASRVADTSLMFTPVGSWMTRTASYNFPGYAVVDETDYLEIDYYGEMTGASPNNPDYLQIMVDDASLDASLQTRIES